MEMNTGEDVQALMKRYNLTYVRLAKISGMYWGTIWRIANGRRRMSNLTRIQLTRVARELATNPHAADPETAASGV